MASKLPSLIIQPKFANQLQNRLPTPLGVGWGEEGFQRGYMLWDQPMSSLYDTKSGPLGDGRDMIRFLFNPSTVSTDYNIANASLQAVMMYSYPGDNANLLAPTLSQTVSWQLYFDRTYELNYGGASSAINDPAVIGVQADIMQFMQFTGILANVSRQQAQQVTGAAGGATAQLTNTGGIMMMVPSYVFFGNANAQMTENKYSANFNALASQMSFYGYISEWSVEYTHWTSNMVPIRASVTVNFTMLPAKPLSSGAPVWKDLQKLGQQPYTVQPPYAPGYSPTPSLNNLTTSSLSNLTGGTA